VTRLDSHRCNCGCGTRRPAPTPDAFALERVEFLAKLDREVAERAHVAAAYRSRHRWFEDRRAPEYETAAV
jgi:hypothetical protein